MGETTVVFYYPKFSHNVGQMARTAELLGVDEFLLINPKRVSIQHATDTSKSFERIGKVVNTVEEAVEHLKGKKIVGVELVEGATPLPEYEHEHSQNVAYVLGAEDVGIPEELLAHCDDIVVIPSSLPWSHNVAQSMTMVVYDRMCKRMTQNHSIPQGMRVGV